jgi:hypothetical protein
MSLKDQIEAGFSRLTLAINRLKAAAPPAVDVQVFSTPGTSTWVKPVGAKTVHIVLYGGGPGGGSGRRRAVGDTAPAAGGAGGGAGGRVEIWIPADSLPSTVSVLVGTGGAGGAPVTIDGTSGNYGYPGGVSKFGNYFQAYGGGYAAGGGAANGATTSSGSAYPCMANGLQAVAPAGGAPTAGAAGGSGSGADLRGGGGGAGGGISSAGVGFAGGSGALCGVNLGVSGLNPGGSIGADGRAGITANLTTFGGVGGSGGGSGQSSKGGNGGAGGFPGGGGGGGGASNAGYDSGAGGKGGDGTAIITTYF